MPDLTPTITALCDRLGFAREQDVIRRFGYEFRVSFDDRVAAWRTIAWSLWAARIVVDQVHSTYDVSTERKKAAARNIYEVPSPHGDREQVLVPRWVAETAANLAEKPFLEATWVDERFVVLFGLSEGFGVHLLGLDELPNVPFDEANIREKARLAHFYASYKARPVSKERVRDECRVKHFHTVDGRTASRALLFPDFDWDAAQDRGSVWIPGRDHLVVGEPLESEWAESAALESRRHARQIDPQIPFFPTRYVLSRDGVEVGDDGWEDRFEAPPERLPLERLA